jgi:NAD+ kinase
MKGDYTIEERMMLTATLIRDGKSLENWQVINDAVVCRGRSVRPIEIEAKVGEYEVARYFADGLITSTPTGSTAYALAAGGPILPPNLRNFLIIPVAPHRSLERAIILPEDSKVTLTVRTSHEAVLSVDGQTPSAVENGDQVTVRVSENTAKFIQFHDPGTYYHKLLKGLSNNSYPTSAA